MRVCGVWAECLKQAVQFPAPSPPPSYRPGLSHTCPLDAQTAMSSSPQHGQDLTVPAANVALEPSRGSLSSCALWNHPRMLPSPLMRSRFSWRMPFPEPPRGVAAQPCTHTPNLKVWKLGHCPLWLGIHRSTAPPAAGPVNWSGESKPITELPVSC